MNFVADENIDIEVINILRKAGYAILSIAEDFPGIPDGEVLEIANNQNAILITGDKDFGELVFRLGRATNGVVLTRILGITQEQKARMILEVFINYANGFTGNFTVIDNKKIRIKRMD